MMKRIVNYRPLCFLAAALSLGVVFGALSMDSLAWRIALLCVFAAAVIALLSLKITRRFFYLPLAVLVGLCGIFGTFDLYNSNKITANEYVFSATVDSEILVVDGQTTFNVSDVYLNDKKLKSNAKIVLNYEIEPDFNAGDIVKISGWMFSFDAETFDTSFASSLVKNRTLYCLADDVEKLADCQPNTILAAQIKLKKAFHSACKDETANIAIGLIYGDKASMNSELFDDIRVSGLSHILAVSGLHVSLLAAAVIFLFKKLKVKKAIYTPIVLVLLFVYSLFCGFPSSVVRAFIMTAVYLLGDCLGRKNDSLSALSLSAVLILVFRPIALFEIGYLLSFTAVLGILLFYRSFQQAFSKCGKTLSASLATTVAANLGTYPVAAACFESFPVFFAIANLIILPIMSVVFVALLLFAVFALILPFSGFLIVFDYLLLPLKVVVFELGSFAVAEVAVAPLGIMSCAYYFDLFTASRFVFLDKRKKAVSISVFTAVCAVASALVYCLA